MADVAAFAASAGRPRREGLPPPLSVWIVAAAAVAVLAAAGAAFFAFVATPMPSENDAAAYEGQLQRLDRQMETLRRAGENPISIVFMGTSRIKNVALNSKDVAQTAKAAGVQRPVASTVLAINWGGFERLEPAIKLVESRRPDVVVMMPALFYDDFNRSSRAWIGFHYLQTKLWHQNYEMFGDYEFHQPACSGFGQSPERRLSLNDQWMTRDPYQHSPELARAAARQLSDRGTLVVLANVPVGRQMRRLRAPLTREQSIAGSGLAGTPNMRVAWAPAPYEDSAYCDWAHIHPGHAEKWRQGFFAAVAADLNRLPVRH